MTGAIRLGAPKSPSILARIADSSPTCHLSFSCPPIGLGLPQNRAVKSLLPEQSKWPIGWYDRLKTASSCAELKVAAGKEGSEERSDQCKIAPEASPEENI